jgi:hypothetical protein
MTLGRRDRGRKRVRLRESVRQNERISRELADKVYDSFPKKTTKGIDRHEFHLGMNIEMEHFDLTKGNLKKTAMITLAHLQELPDYNTRLKEMEEEGEEDKKKGIKLVKHRTFRPSAQPKKEYEEKVKEYFEGFEPVEEETGKEEYED